MANWRIGSEKTAIFNVALGPGKVRCLICKQDFHERGIGRHIAAHTEDEKREFVKRRFAK